MSRPRSLSLLAALALVLLAGLWLATHTSEPLPAPARLMFGRWQVRNLLIALALLWLAGGILASSAGKGGAVRYVLASASFGVFWLVLEGIGAAGLVSYTALLGNEEREDMGLHRVPRLDMTGSAKEDIAEHWSLDRTPIPYRFRTDSNGFRNEPDRASTDIVCLGDSFLVDGLVPHDDLVTARLEKLLGRTAMSIALVGIGPPEQVDLLEQIRPPLDRRLLLHFVFEGNDLLDSAGYRALKEQAHGGPVQAPEKPWTQRTLLNQLVLRLQVLTDPEPAFLRHQRGRIGGEMYYFQWLRQSFEGLEGEIPRVLENLATIRRTVESAGGLYAVVLIPAKIRVLGPFCTYEADSDVADWQSQCGPLPPHLAAWCAKESVAYLDLTEPLRASARAGAIPWFPADTHWNSIGHQVAAETIAAAEPIRDWAAGHSR